MENGGHWRALRSCGGLPNYIWHFRLLARTAASQAAKGGIETPKCHQYACVAQLAGALGSYPSGWRFNPARRYHKQKFDFLKNFCYNIYVEKIQKEKLYIAMVEQW